MNAQAKLFINWTDREFVGRWNSVEYPFAPGQSMFVEGFKADHFAKHLTNRELTKDNLAEHCSPKEIKDNKVFMDYYKKCFGEATVEAPSEDELATELLNVEEKNPKKGASKKTAKASKEEEEFAGLKDDDE